MKTEISAGGVVFKKFGRVLKVLLMRDMNGTWTFPKGMIENGEDPQGAALREIREEVGITKVTIVKALTPIHYMYKRGGLIDKTVHYFICKATGDEPFVVQKEEGVKEAVWVPLPQAAEIIGYPETNRNVLKEAVRQV